MRDIRFRAWDKVEECMSYTKTGIIDNKLIVKFKDNGKYQVTETDNRPDFVEIMQYTELKDKNGKKIYEGDILTFEDSGSVKYTEKITGLVDFFNGAWCINAKLLNGKQYHNELFMNGVPIIIGNKFENPELLI